jgi:hypothetical protein
MFSKTVEWTAIAALIAGAILHSSTGLALVMQFIAVTASIVVLTHTATMGRYIWMTLFLVVAFMFNPVFPIPFSNYIFWTASIFAVSVFFLSLELLKPEPKLSIASITDRMPGSESL